MWDAGARARAGWIISTRDITPLEVVYYDGKCSQFNNPSQSETYGFSAFHHAQARAGLAERLVGSLYARFGIGAIYNQAAG